MRENGMSRRDGWRLWVCSGVFLVLLLAVAWPGVCTASSLEEENARLKARVAELETELAQRKGAPPTESQAMRPSTSLMDHPQEMRGNWWEQVREGVDRVDHFFYVNETKAWALVEYWSDTRGFNTFTVEGASRLPAGFDVWGFTDFTNPDAPGSSRADLEQFFTEIDLKRELWHGLGGIVEYNDGNGRDNNVGRFGAFYQPHWDVLKRMDLWLMTKWFPLGTNASTRQGSVAWNWAPHNILDGRFSTGGFFDLNFTEQDGHHRPQSVSETQLRYRLVGHLNAVLEYRFNEFLAKDQTSGWGLGLQYKF